MQTDTEVAQALEHARERVRAGAGVGETAQLNVHYELSSTGLSTELTRESSVVAEAGRRLHRLAKLREIVEGLPQFKGDSARTSRRSRPSVSSSATAGPGVHGSTPSTWPPSTASGRTGCGTVGLPRGADDPRVPGPDRRDTWRT